MEFDSPGWHCSPRAGALQRNAGASAALARLQRGEGGGRRKELFSGSTQCHRSFIQIDLRVSNRDAANSRGTEA